MYNVRVANVYRVSLFNRPDSVRWGRNYDDCHCVIVSGRLQFGSSELLRRGVGALPCFGCRGTPASCLRGADR